MKRYYGSKALIHLNCHHVRLLSGDLDNDIRKALGSATAHSCQLQLLPPMTQSVQRVEHKVYRERRLLNSVTSKFFLCSSDLLLLTKESPLWTRVAEEVSPSGVAIASPTPSNERETNPLYRLRMLKTLRKLLRLEQVGRAHLRMTSTMCWTLFHDRVTNSPIPPQIR